MTEHLVGAPGPKPPEVILPTEPPALLQALREACAIPEPDASRTAVAAVVAQKPTFLDAWAALSSLARDDVEGYAYARVGYHRGLDALRQNGWRGSGLVRWSHEENRGFLRCLSELARRADRIGESDEAERCGLFLRQLDPDWLTVNSQR